MAVGVDKVKETLPFFKTALEANSSIAQYWMSYIDALIKLDRMADAKAVFGQAKRSGAKGDRFDQLGQRLRPKASNTSNAQNLSLKQLEVLMALYSQDMYRETLNETSRLLLRFPNSFVLYNICGAANQKLNKKDDAIEAYNKAPSIKPDYANFY